ncbi:MAG: signal recognition particle-docking protein FtsY [Clostridiales bacterium]|nr:signal recognition particle-docking protein FtsY [Clostridiales bacterium]MDO4349612.1 signal recognition particle-docking protein FtsY [Eubacteriales bacterium]MDY4009286.1 signal recognition particle-docking protein FtsY [Candidatus Limiplasma sp.]
MTEKKGLFSRLRDGLFKSREHMAVAMDAAVTEHRPIDEDFYDDLLDALILSDMGAACANEAIEKLRERVKAEKLKEAQEAKAVLKQILVDMLEVEKPALHWPMVILMVGVNGVGKTTTIGKLALRFQGLGRTIILCAADTFRAAAADQLQVWSERARCPIVRHKEGADPAGVVFDGVQAAKARNADLLIVDTAGRLHNKKNLMDEMEKIRRVIDREYPEATVRCLLVVDATTGQNGLTQARAFREAAGINGIVLTKLDGTAKGGIAFSIVRELGVPVMYVGVGEGIEDLQSFNAKEFVDALFE